MLTNGHSNAVTNPNSLAMDKELTQLARDISKRIRQRMDEVQHKLDDLNGFSREVSLRVNSASSKMANLKNHKPVKQVISTQNVLDVDDFRPDGPRTDIFSAAFLQSYKEAIMRCATSIGSLENPAVFPTSSHYVPPPATNGVNGGYVNGHTTTSRDVESVGGAESDEDGLSTEGEERKQEDAGAPATPQTVEVEEKRPENLTLPSPILKEPSESSEQKSTSTLQISSQQTMDPLESAEEPAKKSPVPPAMRSTAMASVIGEIREKNATKKFFDSDSDSDTEPLSQTRATTSQITIKTSNEVAPKVAPKVTPKVDTMVMDIDKPKGPPAARSAATPKSEPPSQPKPTRKAPINDPKKTEAKTVAKNLFDSDSESDTEFLKPPPKPTLTPSLKQPLPVASKPSENNTPTEAKVPQLAAAPVNVPGKKASSTVTPTLGKSLFSDSDSDDDFLKSFSKPKATPKVVVAEKTVTSKATIAEVKPNMTVVEELTKKSVEDVAPKKEELPKVNPATKSAIRPAATTTTTTIPRKVEAKKPVSQSLFDDSDSDSDLFSAKSKPKTVVAPTQPKKESTPPVLAKPEAKMEPSSSEQTEEPARRKKEATSESMSAKISLIAEMQKNFRLPGQTAPAKAVTEEVRTPQEEVDTVGAILKNRCRGPSNRRPPTRVRK